MAETDNIQEIRVARLKEIITRYNKSHNIKMTQSDIARAVGTHREVINRKLNGIVPITNEDCIVISKIFNVNCKYLAGSSDELERQDDEFEPLDPKTTVDLYPDNIIQEIQESISKSYPEAQLTRKGYLNFVNDKFSPREKDIIELRWKYKKTYDEAADIYKISRERIRQVELKALRRLKCISNILKYCCVPFDIYYQAQKEKETAEMRFDFLLSRIDNLEVKQSVEKFQPVDNMPIEYLGLSARAYNSLKRAGVNTINDVLLIPNIDILAGLTNIGKGSVNEITSKIHLCGYKMKWEDED